MQDRWERRAAKQQAKRRQMRLHGAGLRTVVPNAILKRVQRQPSKKGARA